jgi:hypothetical protein
MENARLIALDRLIAAIQEGREEYRQELSREIAARAESPLYTDEHLAEDIANDEGLLVFDEMLEHARARRSEAEQK